MAFYGICPGHNIADPTALHLLQPPLFQLYEFGVPDNWIQESENTGDHTLRYVGLPLIQWIMTLRQTEVDYWLTYTPNNSLVTIRQRAWNVAGAPFHRFNTRVHWVNLIDGTRELIHNDFWNDAIIEFVDPVDLGT